jgi:hypothetical protein
LQILAGNTILAARGPKLSFLLDVTKSHLVYGCRVSPSSVDSWSLLLSNFPVFRVLGLSVCPMVTTFCDIFLTTF